MIDTPESPLSQDASIAEVPDSNETTPHSFTVKAYNALELDDATLERLDLYSLVREGTDFDNEESVKNLTKGLFQNAEPPSRFAYIAEADGKAIGYLLFNKLNMNDADPLGYAFASWLYTHNPDFANEIWDSQETVAVVHGVTTSTDWREKGVQRKLWEQMIQETDPTIILGDSKNPAAVVARAKALASHGYSTYFGPVDVTPNSDENKPTPPIINSLINTNISLHTAGGGPIEEINDKLILAPSTNFAATTPDVSTFPPVIQRAFQPVIDAQAKFGENKTVVQQLISVKNTLLGNQTVNR